MRAEGKTGTEITIPKEQKIVTTEFRRIGCDDFAARDIRSGLVRRMTVTVVKLSAS